MGALLIGLFLVVIPILLLYLYMTRNFNYWKHRNVPFIKPIPIFGNIWKVCKLESNIGDVLHEIHNSVKLPYVGIFLLDQPILLIRDNDLIKNILIKDFDHFMDRSLAHVEIDKMSSNILFVVKNPKWKRIRTKVTPIFTSGKIKGMLPLIMETGEELKRYIEEVAIHEKSTDVRDLLLRYTSDNISSCAFGINANSLRQKDAPILVAAKRLFDWNVKRAFAFYSYFMAPMLVRIFRLRFIDGIAGEFFSTVFWNHMNERERTGISRGDFIDLLIELRRTKGTNYLDDDAVLAQSIQFFLGGYETTGTTLTFALFELARNPSIQRELRTETRNALKTHGELTYEMLGKMKFLNNIVTETLRMYPILPYLDRRCTKAYQVPDTDLVIEEGCAVYISVLGLHYDSDVFPDPYKFDPNRFSEEGAASNFLPFGDGPHNCIGLRFAILALKVALAQITLHFEVEPCSTTPEKMKFEPKGFLLSPPDGKLDLHFRKVSDVEGTGF